MYIYCIYHNMIGLSDYELFRPIKYRKPISNVNKQVKKIGEQNIKRNTDNKSKVRK